MYTKIAGETDIEVITTAVWSGEEALDQAKKSVLAEMQKRGINPREIMQELGVTAERGLYQIRPY
jgi:hypothetical protein